MTHISQVKTEKCVWKFPKADIFDFLYKGFIETSGGTLARVEKRKPGEALINQWQGVRSSENI
jgi:hypothetical protein